ILKEIKKTTIKIIKITKCACLNDKLKPNCLITQNKKRAVNKNISSCFFAKKVVRKIDLLLEKQKSLSYSHPLQLLYVDNS
ncbi:hypothetical protein FF38_03295, partial [Lucilia cuprina]